ncbi:Uncharacterised protein [Vibrio cholerae]|uniref:Uncharacterized protein n=1 Tax=Vibrio cholerae TaxID=666 RepID=A0A655YGS9_VIBCL|nr:Uncharacterised protein [Vibrio cholerae]
MMQTNAQVWLWHLNIYHLTILSLRRKTIYLRMQFEILLSALSTKQILPTFSTHNTQKNKIQLSKLSIKFEAQRSAIIFNKNIPPVF